jgi:hypothetical protein
MSSIPSFITDITSSIYGQSYDEASLIEQFASQLGLTPGEAIPDTEPVKEAYIAFLSSRLPVVQYISSLSTALLGSDANNTIQGDISSFRSMLGLQPSDALPDTDATEEQFAGYMAQRYCSASSIISLAENFTGSATSILSLLSGFRASIGLQTDLPIPNTAATGASFLSYLSTQSSAFSFISQLSLLATGSNITVHRMEDFRAYLGLQNGEPLPDNYDTCAAYVDFLGQTNSFVAYAATAIKNTYETSLVANLSLLSEFRADLGLSSGDAIGSDNDTKHDFLYFLTSPTIVAAQGFYGISDAAAQSITQFRATLGLSSGSAIPADAATAAQYLAFLQDGRLDIAQFMEDTTETLTATAVTNDIITSFRTYLSLKDSDPIPDDDATKAKFMAFMQQKLAAIGRSAAVNALSPNEIAVRQVLFSAFSVVLQMLNTIEQSTRVEAKALQVYAEWEKQYTNLITQTPIYGPTDQNQIVANNGDFGATTLGQDNVSVRNVAQWLLNQIQTKNTSSETFTIHNPVFVSPGSSYPGFPSFTMTKNADGTYTFSVNAPNTDAWGGYIGYTTILLSATASLAPDLGGEAQNIALVESLLTTMTQKWQNDQFASSNFNLYITAYSRDSAGILSAKDDFWMSRPTTYLKTLWSGKEIDVNFPDTDFNGYASPQAAFQDIFDDDSSVTVTPVPGMNQTILELVMGNLPESAVQNSYVQIATISGGDYNGSSLNIQINNESTSSSPNSYRMMFYLREPDGTLDWSSETTFTTTSVNSFAGTGLWGPWNGPGAGAWQETIPYPSDYDKASLQNVRSQSSSYVGEINAQLQQYVQSAQAQKTNLDNSMKVLQNLMTQTTQATTNQSNLLDSIMQSFRSILSSIFH